MDVGQLVEVDRENVFRLLDPFIKQERLAWRCCLNGVYPPRGGWGIEVQMSIIESMLQAIKIIIFPRRRQTSTTSFVTVIYKIKCDGGPLELPGFKWINLNEQLIDLKLALSKPDPVAQLSGSWKEPPPTEILNQFQAKVTWVNMKGEVYLYDINKSEKQLNQIKEQLNSVFHDSEQQESDRNCQPGDPCIAK